MNARDLFFAFLSYEITGAPLPEGIPDPLPAKTADALFYLAEHHSLIHLIADAIEKSGISPGSETIWQEIRKKKKYQLAYFLQMENALEELKAALNSAEIPYLPLKGAVLRRFYPEEWMRNSCDIDILVHPDDRERAEKAVEAIGFSDRTQYLYDVSYYRGQVHLELHSDLLEEDRANNAHALLTRVWDYAQKKQDSFEYELSDAMFYFYHLAHMAKHIEIGGCGVRSFADLWILDHAVPFSAAEREKLLEQGGLSRFARAAKALSEVWFSGAEPTEQTRSLEEYILTGGSYGNLKNRVFALGARRKNKFSYLGTALFPSRKALSLRFPILEKRPWLLPFCWVARWFLLLFKPSSRKKLKTGVKATGRIDRAGLEETRELMRSLGLQDGGER